MQKQRTKTNCAPIHPPASTVYPGTTAIVLRKHVQHTSHPPYTAAQRNVRQHVSMLMQRFLLYRIGILKHEVFRCMVRCKHQWTAKHDKCGYNSNTCTPTHPYTAHPPNHPLTQPPRTAVAQECVQQRRSTLIDRAPFDDPRSRSFALGPVLSQITPCAAG